ncbi:MAG: PIG-L deacetylase family protein [Elusimicrobiota bacterium]|nr:PIG-L deacetylase family protein [Elusimicrobiota bacterium]
MKTNTAERPSSRREDVFAKYAGKNVIAVGAHPDDIELGCGGTLARLVRAGARVTMVVVSIPSNVRTRRREAIKAAKVLGCDIRFLNPDRPSRVEDLKTHQLVGMLDSVVKELQPAAMFTHSLSGLHLDHKLTHEACMSSKRLRFFDVFCYSPTDTHAVNIPFFADVWVDTFDTIEVKMKAIQAHASRFKERGLTPERYRDIDVHMGRLVGLECAEGFEVGRMRVDRRTAGDA